MPLNILRCAFLLGLILAALTASSAVAWQFGFARELGPPLFWRIYNPLAVIAWARAWGLEQAYRSAFLSGVSTALLPAFLPLLALRLVELYGPLQPAEAANPGLGRPAGLLATGHIRARGDGVVLGRHGRKVLRDASERHVGIIGPSGAGKGAGHVVPTLLLHQGSMLVFDPKHELAAITARRRRAFGPVHVLNPLDPEGAVFNPLAELRDGADLVGDCQMLAHMLAHPGTAPPGHDSYWDDAAAMLLTALLVQVRRSPEPTLAHLWRLALDLKAGRYPTPDHPLTQRVLDAHARTAERVRDSIESTMLVRLAFLADPLVQASTAASSFSAGDLQAGAAPATVFLSIPVSHAHRLRPLSRVMLQSLFAPLTHAPHHLPDGRAKRRGLLALLDEFPQLGRMEAIEQGVAIGRGYGLRFCLVCQDEDQIRSIYGPSQSLTANLETIAFYPGFSAHALDTVAGWGGHHTVARRAKSRALGSLRPPGLSESEALVPVLGSRELLLRGREEVLILTHGCRPTYLRKVRYFARAERAFRGLWDPPAPPAASAVADAPLAPASAKGVPPWLTSPP